MITTYLCVYYNDREMLQKTLTWLVDMLSTYSFNLD